MKWVALGLCLAAFPAGALAQASSPLYTTFQTMCVAHDGAAAPALAAADASGWLTLNSSMVPMPSSGAFKLSHYQVRLNIAGGRTLVLVTGEGTTSASGQPLGISMCLVLSRPADPAGLDMARAWLDMAPLLSSPQISLYLFGKGEIKPLVLDRDGAQRALKDGAARMVMIPAATSGGSLLIYAIPRPVT